MQKKWNVTAVSPLGQESYELIITKNNDNSYIAVGQENRGKIDFIGSLNDDSLILSGYTEFPMRTKVLIEINSFNFDSDNIEGNLNIGDFCKIPFSGAKS